MVTDARDALVMAQFVYILASRPGGAIYVGRSKDLRQRLAAHHAGLSIHTQRYNIRKLVWFEQHHDFETSLRRERSIKRWHRTWKLQLIATHNPDWHDLTPELLSLPVPGLTRDLAP